MGYYRVQLLHRYEEAGKRRGESVNKRKKERLMRATAQQLFLLHGLAGNNDRSKERTNYKT